MGAGRRSAPLTHASLLPALVQFHTGWNEQAGVQRRSRSRPESAASPWPGPRQSPRRLPACARACMCVRAVGVRPPTQSAACGLRKGRGGRRRRCQRHSGAVGRIRTGGPERVHGGGDAHRRGSRRDTWRIWSPGNISSGHLDAAPPSITSCMYTPPSRRCSASPMPAI